MFGDETALYALLPSLIDRLTAVAERAEELGWMNADRFRDAMGGWQ